MSQAVLPGKKDVVNARKGGADSFLYSLVLLGWLVLVQRGIGFLRSCYVCGSLSSAEVGRWDLVYGFLTMVAPLAVFGIPGSFGRYVARFELHGQTRRLLLNTLVACVVLTTLASAVVFALRDLVAAYFFGDAGEASLVGLLALGMPAVVFFNFATCWFTGKRLNRVVFRIQLTQSICFAVFCVVALQFIQASALSVVFAFLLSCLVGLAVGAACMWLQRHQDRHSSDGDETLSIWRRVLPFAAWVWLSNAMMNVFGICDRMLLVNCYPDPSIDTQSLIGQYHAARVFPLLLMSIGGMAASMLMPYLSKDWESKNHSDVADRMNLMLKGVGMLCLAGSLFVLLIAPILFGELWRDKFAIGQSLLPMTLCYCSLAAVAVVSQKYFWCIEKTWFSSLLLLVGLLSNIGLGIAWIGSHGIEGVVASTLAAHAIVLVGSVILCRRHGLKLDVGVLLTCLALFGLCFGTIAACCCFAILLIATLSTELFLSQPLKQLIVRHVGRYIGLAGGN